MVQANYRLIKLLFLPMYLHLKEQEALYPPIFLILYEQLHHQVFFITIHLHQLLQQDLETKPWFPRVYKSEEMPLWEPVQFHTYLFYKVILKWAMF